MTDKEFLKRMAALTEDLAAASNAEPYDPDEYNKVIDKIVRACMTRYCSRHIEAGRKDSE